MNSTRTKLIILAGLVVAVLVCRFYVCSVAMAFALVKDWGYWIMAGGVGVYAFYLTGWFRRGLSVSFFRAHRVGLLAALLGVLLLEVHEQHRFKVLYDEFTISGVARNMHFMREVSFPVRAHNINDNLRVTGVSMDKRPLFFQFILCCVHDLTGYRPENVFFLNGVAAFGLLFLTYYFGSQSGGQSLGLACMALWLGLPLLAQAATSGGYDVFNLVMLMLFWLFGRRYLQRGDILDQGLFVLTTVHLAQVRYESILFIVPMACIISLRWLRQKSIQVGWVLAMSPVFLLLPLLINLYYVRTPSYMQVEAGQSFFGFEYIQENIERAVWYMFNVDFDRTNSAILSVLGGIAFVAFMVKMVSLRRQLLLMGDNIVMALMAIVILSNFVLILCNFWGQLNDATASRFSLPLYLLFICCFGWFVNEWLKGRRMPIWLAVLAVLPLLMGIPAAARSAATRTLWQGREFQWFFQKLDAPEHYGALVISNPVGPILYGHPAVSLEDAEANKWKIQECIKNRLYSEIIVLERWIVDLQTLQEIPYSDDARLNMKKGKYVVEHCTALSKAFKRETIAELRISPGAVLRMSRIVGVEGPDIVPPKEYLEDGPPFKNVGVYLDHVYKMLP